MAPSTDERYANEYDDRVVPGTERCPGAATPVPGGGNTQAQILLVFHLCSVV